MTVQILPSSVTHTGDGVTVRFDTGWPLTSPQDLIAVIGGVFQLQSAYTVDGSAVVYNTAPPDGVIIEHRIIAQPSLEGFIVTVSDESSTLTAGTAKLTFRMPYAFTLAEVRASLSTASTSGVVTVTIKEGGVSLFGSNKLTIAQGSRTSVGGIAPTLSDTSLANDAEITVDVDGAGTGAKGLKIALIGTRSTDTTVIPPAPPATNTWATGPNDSWNTTGMVCLLDLGQAASYSGSGTTVANVVPNPADGSAQAAYNFAITNSLTFTGTAGARSSGEYLTANGNGWLGLAANTAFTNSLHKAGAAYTVEWVVRNVTNFTPMLTTGTTSGYSPPSMMFVYNNAAQFNFALVNDSTGVYGADFGSPSAATGGLAHIVLSVNAASSFFMVNGVVVATFTFPASGLSTNASALPLRLWGGTGHTAPSGRLHAFALRNVALTQAQATAQFGGIRARWGL